MRGMACFCGWLSNGSYVVLRPALSFAFAKRFRRPVGRRLTFSCLPKRKLGKEKGTLRTPSLSASAEGTRIEVGFSAVLPAPSKRLGHPCPSPCGLIHLAPLGSRREPEDQHLCGSLRIARGLPHTT